MATEHELAYLHAIEKEVVFKWVAWLIEPYSADGYRSGHPATAGDAYRSAYQRVLSDAGLIYLAENGNYHACDPEKLLDWHVANNLLGESEQAELLARLTLAQLGELSLRYS